MNTSIKLLAILCFLLYSTNGFSQKTIKEYVSKNSVEKLKKAIGTDVFTLPATQKSFKDGHGKNPYFSSKEQLPDTIALITFHLNDLGFSESWTVAYTRYTKYYSVSEAGGNRIANIIQEHTIEGLKEEFRKRGAVLLTPDEFLDTPEKTTFYNDEFAPEVSKMGKFLSDFESRKTDISVCADNYRYFDIGAAFDYKRSISLGSELANKLGVDAVLSIAILIQTFKKDAYTKAVKMALNGRNPIPRVDKKYYGQKTGTGYYDGQLYTGGTFIFKKPIRNIIFEGEQISSVDFDGIDVVFNSFIERFYDEMNKAIDKVSK